MVAQIIWLDSGCICLLGVSTLHRVLYGGRYVSKCVNQAFGLFVDCKERDRIFKRREVGQNVGKQRGVHKVSTELEAPVYLVETLSLDGFKGKDSWRT
jgi:hypothetical protein